MTIRQPIGISIGIVAFTVIYHDALYPKSPNSEIFELTGQTEVSAFINAALTNRICGILWKITWLTDSNGSIQSCFFFKRFIRDLQRLIFENNNNHQ